MASADSDDTPTGGFVLPEGVDLADLDLDDLRESGQIDEAAAKQMAAEMAEARDRIAEMPAEELIANHLMGIYEIAAIHLMHQPPSLPDAALAIDAMGAVVEGVGVDRLGQHGPVLAEALSQIRMAFVQVKQQLLTAEAADD
jgi:hypothetical protein